MVSKGNRRLFELMDMLSELGRLQEKLEESELNANDWQDEHSALKRRFDELDKSALETLDLLQSTSNQREQKLIAEIKNINNGLRPEVQWFAQRMEAKLKANDHKPHWEGSAIEELVYCLTIELAELRLAIEKGESAEDIINEAADVANYSMMIADNADRLRDFMSPKAK